MQLKPVLKKLLFTLPALALLGGISVWMLFQHIPDWYEPPEVPQAEYQRVRDELLSAEDRFTADLVAGRPFEYVLEDRQLNEWISTRHAIWAPAAKWIPEQIENPVIRFLPDQVAVAGLLHFGDLKVIGSIHLSLDVVEDQLSVKLLHLQGGSLPVPGSWVVNLLLEFWDELGAKNLKDIDLGGKTTSEEIAAQIARLPIGALFPATARWPNGKQDFRLRGIRTEQGRLVLTVQPHSDKYSSK
jgi:hypothetical protein